MLLFKDILTFLGLDYRDALLITLITKSDKQDFFNIQNHYHKSKKSAYYKWIYGLSGIDY